MFNVGIIGGESSVQAVAVKLTSRSVPAPIYDEYGGWSEAAVLVTPGGSISLNGGYTTISPADEWAFPRSSGLGSGYELRATRIAGATVSSTFGFGTWVAINTNRALYVTGPTGGDVVRLEIRKVGGPTLATADYTFY